jgi:hypothetical protein
MILNFVFLDLFIQRKTKNITRLTNKKSKFLDTLNGFVSKASMTANPTLNENLTIIVLLSSLPL